jgi:hypothetical protein
MRYEIDENNAVLCFIDPQPQPVLFQPYDPAGDGKGFKSKADAEKWAKAYVNAWEVEQAKLAKLPSVIPAGSVD